jgi:hypothetical protein
MLFAVILFGPPTFSVGIGIGKLLSEIGLLKHVGGWGVGGAGANYDERAVIAAPSLLLIITLFRSQRHLLHLFL